MRLSLLVIFASIFAINVSCAPIAGDGSIVLEAREPNPHPLPLPLARRGGDYEADYKRSSDFSPDYKRSSDFSPDYKRSSDFSPDYKRSGDFTADYKRAEDFTADYKVKRSGPWLNRKREMGGSH